MVSGILYVIRAKMAQAKKIVRRNTIVAVDSMWRSNYNCIECVSSIRKGHMCHSERLESFHLVTTKL